MAKGIPDSAEEHVSITEAASLAGIDVGVIRRAVKAGKIVSKSHPWGLKVRLIDVAQLPNLSSSRREQLLKRAEDYSAKVRQRKIPTIHLDEQEQQNKLNSYVRVGQRGRKPPGSLESLIINQISQMQQPVTVAEAQKCLLTERGAEYEYTVLLKTIQRLVIKKKLVTTKIGATNLFALVMPDEEFVRLVVRKVVQSLIVDFGMDPIIHCLNSGTIGQTPEVELGVDYHVGEWSWNIPPLR